MRSEKVENRLATKNNILHCILTSDFELVKNCSQNVRVFKYLKR
jgi:hypothetical protein